jgi:hypothetical protein
LFDFSQDPTRTNSYLRRRENVRQNLNDPEQEEVADQVKNEIMARDKKKVSRRFMWLPPVATRKSFTKCLAFLKQVLHEDTLEDNLMDTKEFVHRALSDAAAIASENIQMFQLIRKAVKKEMGQKELLQVLNPELYFHPRKRNSFTPNFFLFCQMQNKRIIQRNGKDCRDEGLGIFPVDSAHVDDKETKDKILLHPNWGGSCGQLTT